MSRQLTFDLPHRPAMGRDDFFVSSANQTALAGIEQWAEWPLSKMVLIGPEGAGKTHLVHVWAAKSGAEIAPAQALETGWRRYREAPALAIEDADTIAGNRAAEEALFHLHNGFAERQAPLLLTARNPPSLWQITLPDLASRMAQTGLLRMDLPDDALLLAVMVKLSLDVGLSVPPSTLSYAVRRIERSFTAAAAFIAALDAVALAEQRAPSRELAKKVLSTSEEL
ncbi:MAG: DnaA/Hda family protein [Pseudomonadota bacterium]